MRGKSAYCRAAVYESRGEYRAGGAAHNHAANTKQWKWANEEGVGKVYTSQYRKTKLKTLEPTDLQFEVASNA